MEIKKLHVDSAARGGLSGAQVEGRASGSSSWASGADDDFLLTRLALVSDESTSKDDVLAVMNELNGWLSVQTEESETKPVSTRIFTYPCSTIACCCIRR